MNKETRKSNKTLDPYWPYVISRRDNMRKNTEIGMTIYDNSPALVQDKIFYNALEPFYRKELDLIRQKKLKLSDISTDTKKYRNRYYISCLTACSVDGSNISSVPAEILSEEICIAACLTSDDILNLVPEKFKTIRVYEAAMKTDITAFFTIKPEHLTRELYIIAINIKHYVLKWIPESEIDKEMAKIAFGVNKRAIMYIPTRHLTHDMCIEACLSSILLITFVPANMQTRRFKDIVFEDRM